MTEAAHPFDRARAYADVLGIADADEHWRHESVRTRRVPVDPGDGGLASRWIRRVQWVHYDWPISTKAFVRALDGKLGLAAKHLRRVSCIILDLDAHDLPASKETGEEVLAADFVDRSWRAQRARSEALANRAAIAKRLRRSVSAIRKVVPETLVESSPRGLHVVLVLDRSVPVSDARALGLAIVAAAGLAGRPDVEVFPKVEGEGLGHVCHLPLTERSRLLDRDLVTAKHTRRAADVAELLTAARVDLDLLRGRLQVPAGPAGDPSFPSSPSETHTHVPERIQGRSRKRARVEPAEGQLFGADFSAEVVRLARCIPAGGSLTFARRFAALAVYADLDDDEAIALFRASIERPGHEATHCKTKQGRGQLVGSTFRSCLRRQRKGVDAGEVQPGLLKNRDAWRLIESLRCGAELEAAAEAKATTPPKTWAEKIATRRAAASKAAAARWAKVRTETTAPTKADVDRLVDEAEMDRLACEVARVSPTHVLREFLLEAVIARLVILEQRRKIRGRRPRP